MTKTAVPVLLVLVAWGIRLHHLGALSFWIDEGFSYDVARHGIPTILATLPAEDRHPPLHYILLWLTLRAAGPSEFSLRFLSAGVGLLAIPLVYRVGALLGGVWIGFLAAVLLALSPFQVWYSQEARMYALFATLGLASWVFFLRLIRKGSRYDWLAYVVLTAATLYTHYYAIFLLPAQAIAFALIGDWRRRWRAVVLGMMAAGALFLPWLLAIWRQYQRASLGYRPEIGLPSAVGNVLATYTFGESASFESPFVVVAVALATLGALPAPDPSGAPPRDAKERWPGVILVAWALAAPLGAYLVSAVIGLDIRATGRMYYIAGLPAFVLLVARGLVWLEGYVRLAGRGISGYTAEASEDGLPPASAVRWPARPRRLAGVANPALPGPRRFRGIPGFTSRGTLAALPLIAILGLGLVGAAEATTLQQQFVAHKKEDFRGAAQIVAQNEWPGDTIILDAEYIYRPFTYYYQGPAPWNRAVVEPGRVDDAMQQQTSGHPRVWLVLSHAEFADLDHRVQGWLDQHATPLQDWWLDGIHVRLYSMEQRPRLDRPTVTHPIDARLGDRVEVVGVDAPAAAVGGATARLTVVWHALGRPTEDDHAVLMLVDPTEHIWQQVDHVPISPFYLPTAWQPGEYLTDRYDLGLPVGLPPGSYALRLKLYDPANGRAFTLPNGNQFADLGKIQIDPSPASALLPGTDVAAGLRLIGATLDRTTAQPGDDVVADLEWQATAAPDGPRQVTLRLVDARGKPSAERAVTVGGAFPFERWRSREVIHDREVLRLPGRLGAGSYDVRVGDSQSVDVGKLTVAPIARTFTAPTPGHVQVALLQSADGSDVARLLGYDLTPASVAPGGMVRLTLYWQAAGEPSVDYTVFTHVVGPDRRIHAQRDNTPQQGARPTGGWLKGEIIRDVYDVQVGADAPPGSYDVEIGMYRPDTGARLTVGPGTSVKLGETIDVAPAH